MDRQLVGASHEIVKKIFDTTERYKIKEVTTKIGIYQVYHIVQGWELFLWVDTCLAHLMKQLKYIWYDRKR